MSPTPARVHAGLLRLSENILPKKFLQVTESSNIVKSNKIRSMGMASKKYFIYHDIYIYMYLCTYMKLRSC